MLFWNLPQILAVSQAQMVADACGFWARSWSRTAEAVASAAGHQDEPWLDRSRGAWPHVRNCAASAYSRWGVNLAQAQPVNDDCYQTDCRKA